MKKFEVACTAIYNGYITVEAENESEAAEKARENFSQDKTNNVPCTFTSGDVIFTFGELTADYADEVEGEDEDTDTIGERF